MLNATKDDIQKLARTDATVHACLYAHQRQHGITWERALCAMVIYLAEEKNALVAAELSRRRRMTPAELIAESNVPRITP